MSAQSRSSRRIFAPLLEPSSFEGDIALVETSRRAPDYSADQSIEVQRKHYTRSFSLRDNRVRGCHFQSRRSCPPCETLVAFNMSDRHRCRRELRLLYPHTTSFAQLARVESLYAGHGLRPLGPFLDVDHDVPDSLRGGIDVDRDLVVPHACNTARTCEWGQPPAISRA